MSHVSPVATSHVRHCFNIWGGGGRGLVKCLQGVRGWMLELEEDEEEVEELVDKEEEDGEDEGEK